VGTTSRTRCRMDERTYGPFISAGCAVTRACVGDSCWDMTLRCRCGRSLGSDVECTRWLIIHSLGGQKAADAGMQHWDAGHGGGRWETGWMG